MEPNPSEPIDQLLSSLNGRSLPSEEIDFEALKLPQDYSEATAGKKLHTTIPVRKPKKHEFVRAFPDPEWHYRTMLYLDPESSDFYLLAPDFWEELGGHAHPFLLIPTLTRFKTLFLWPLRLPGVDGRRNSWHDSALEAAELAQHKWIRLSPNQELGAYDLIEAAVRLTEPDWSVLDDLTLERLLQLAFKRRLINSPDHDLLQRLRGEV